MISDDELMSSIINGNDDAFEKLVLRYRSNAVNFAKKYLKDEFLAEDVIQESFAIIYVKKKEYKFSCSFKTYLYTIIRNKCIDLIRKRRTVSLDNIENLQAESSVEEIVIEHENKIFLAKIFAKLNTDYKIVLYLYEFENMSYKEIGKVMGKNLGQVKIMIYRTRKKLISLSEGVR